MCFFAWDVLPDATFSFHPGLGPVQRNTALWHLVAEALAPCWGIQDSTKGHKQTLGAVVTSIQHKKFYLIRLFFFQALVTNVTNFRISLSPMMWNLSFIMIGRKSWLWLLTSHPFWNNDCYTHTFPCSDAQTGAVVAPRTQGPMYTVYYSDMCGVCVRETSWRFFKVTFNCAPLSAHHSSSVPCDPSESLMNRAGSLWWKSLSYTFCCFWALTFTIIFDIDTPGSYFKVQLLKAHYGWSWTRLSRARRE